jgi:hypothetical protein
MYSMGGPTRLKVTRSPEASGWSWFAITIRGTFHGSNMSATRNFCPETRTWKRECRFNQELLLLAQDLAAIWDAPDTDSSIKQRIVGILIQQIIVDIDETKDEISLFIHWTGGRHSEVRVAKHKRGQNGRCTSMEAIDIVRQMAAQYSDGEIALTLNRLRLKTGTGNTWNETRIRSLRSQLKLVHQSTQGNDSSSNLNLEGTAKRLKVSGTVVRRLINLKILPATQVVVGAPWQIAVDDVESPTVIQAALRLQRREPLAEPCPQEVPLPLPGFESRQDTSTFWMLRLCRVVFSSL